MRSTFRNHHPDPNSVYSGCGLPWKCHLRYWASVLFNVGILSLESKKVKFPNWNSNWLLGFQATYHNLFDPIWICPGIDSHWGPQSRKPDGCKAGLGSRLAVIREHVSRALKARDPHSFIYKFFKSGLLVLPVMRSPLNYQSQLPLLGKKAPSVSS